MFDKTTAPKRSNAASPAATDDWLALVGRISNEEQEALAEFYDLTKRQVFGLLLRILNDERAAEEVLLDVYMQIWRQARHYDVKRGAPQAWVTTIARSRAIDRLRSGKHEVKLKEPLDLSRIASIAYDGVDLVADSERRKYVGEALDSLPNEQREVIELAYFQGLSQTEIALKLAQPLGTVKTRTRLGLTKLRESLKPLVEGAL
jgi:RNA polymerase sigma-70 factor (ECF subfamily)